MIPRLKRILSLKSRSAFLALALCLSVLGLQSIGLSHGVHHVNQGHHLQANSIFDEIEKTFSSDPQKAEIACKLLDSLLLGASVASQHVDINLIQFSHQAFTPVILIILALPKIWSYQSQAPPQFNPQ
jgi:hypothetical protein